MIKQECTDCFGRSFSCHFASFVQCAVPKGSESKSSKKFNYVNEGAKSQSAIKYCNVTEGFFGFTEIILKIEQILSWSWVNDKLSFSNDP